MNSPNAASYPHVGAGGQAGVHPAACGRLRDALAHAEQAQRTPHPAGVLDRGVRKVGVLVKGIWVKGYGLGGEGCSKTSRSTF